MEACILSVTTLSQLVDMDLMPFAVDTNSEVLLSWIHMKVTLTLMSDELILPIVDLYIKRSDQY